MSERIDETVIKEDKRLEDEVESASEELAKHRWHWTLNPDNSDRVSISEYAQAVGRAKSTISKYANAYKKFRHGETPVLQDALRAAQRGADTVVAAEAVAEARGVSPSTKSVRKEAQQVRDEAREVAERKGTSVEEEAPGIAQRRVKRENQQKKQKDERAERLGLRFVEMESHFATVERRLDKAGEIADEVQWTDEHRELLDDSVARIRSKVELLSLKIAGTAEIDWDAEWAALTKETN